MNRDMGSSDFWVTSVDRVVNNQQDMNKMSDGDQNVVNKQ